MWQERLLATTQRHGATHLKGRPCQGWALMGLALACMQLVLSQPDVWLLRFLLWTVYISLRTLLVLVKMQQPIFLALAPAALTAVKVYSNCLLNH